MKTLVTATASFAVIAITTFTAAVPSQADTLRRVTCPDGRVVTASGTQTDAQACRGFQRISAKPKRATQPSMPSAKKLTSGGATPTAIPDNTAHAWTSACYAEFGPNAKYPDAALLAKCLNY